jgi:hypothetical protein
VKSKATFFQILPVFGLDPSSIVTVRGVSRVMVGIQNFSTVVGDIKFEEAPESIRVGIAAWSLVYISISKRGDILDCKRQTNSILLLHKGPIWV